MKKLLCIIATLVLVGCQPLQLMRQDEVLVAVGYDCVSEETVRTVDDIRGRALRAWLEHAFLLQCDQFVHSRWHNLRPLIVHPDASAVMVGNPPAPRRR